MRVLAVQEAERRMCRIEDSCVGGGRGAGGMADACMKKDEEGNPEGETQGGILRQVQVTDSVMMEKGSVVDGEEFSKDEEGETKRKSNHPLQQNIVGVDGVDLLFQFGFHPLRATSNLGIYAGEECALLISLK